MALWGAGFDEYSQQPSNIFSEIISKALADHLGYAIFFGTPKGKNEFHRIYKAGLNDPNWTVIFKTIEDSLKDETGETIDNLRIALEDDKKLVAQGLMTQDEFNQEWYCSFEAAVKGAYYAKELAEARKSRITDVPYDRALPVHIVMDLGIGQALGAGFYQKSAGQFRMIDYWQGTEKQAIPDAIKAFKNKDYVYSKVFLPHDAEGTEQGSGKTRKAIFKELWPSVEIIIIPKLAVDDGINRGKLALGRMYIDKTNCATFLDLLSGYHQEWNEQRGMFEEKPYHDFTSHAADVHRYASIVENEMINETYSVPANTEWNSHSEYGG